MKLVFAIKSLSTLGGGAERVFADVVKELRARGHDIGVLTFEPARSESFYDLGPGIVRLDMGAAKAGKAGQLLSLPRARHEIVSARPDAVVAFMPSCYVPLGAALAFTGIPFIASEHNVPARYEAQPLRWLSIKMASAYATRFTAVSAQMREQYPWIVRRKMVVMPNPVGRAGDAQADPVGPMPGRGRILAVGRLHNQKDHLTLIRAFSLLAAEFPGWSLRILGDGSERGRLEKEISQLGLFDRVELPGTVRDIAAEYLAAQLYVIPSRYESLGLATVEALAHGLPAVGFADCPGTNELIGDGINGVLVDPGSDRVANLAAALKRLIASPVDRKRLAAGAVMEADANGPDAVAYLWENLLQQIVATRQP